MKKTAMLCMAMFLGILSILPAQTVYGADPVQVSLKVEQVFDKGGSDAVLDDTFGYRLTPIQSGNPMPAVSDCTIKGSESAAIGPITFHQEGDYSYEIALMAPPSGKAYTCDQQVYTVTVYVRSSGGALTAKTVIKNGEGEKTDKLLYTHTYRAAATDSSLMVDPPVKKTVSGTPAKDSVFLFSLTAEDPKNPMPQGSEKGRKTMTITGSGEKDFGTWSYTKAGTYYYTIAEVDTDEKGYTYDTAVYTITDRIKDVDGQLVQERVITNSAGKQVTSCSFINRYAGDGKSPAGGGLGGGLLKPGNGPKTGDDTHRDIFLLALTLSGLTAVGCVSYLRYEKRRKKDQEMSCPPHA